MSQQMKLIYIYGDKRYETHSPFVPVEGDMISIPFFSQNLVVSRRHYVYSPYGLNHVVISLAKELSKFNYIDNLIHEEEFLANVYRNKGVYKENA